MNIEELRKSGVVKLKEKDMFALWVKTGCCNLTSKQLTKLAELAEKYARSYVLFTTRQIPIIPFVHVKDVERVKDELSQVRLELDRCGPTVRNINVCYGDKICADAETNALSLAEKLNGFFHVPITHKIKIGVAGCKKDCIISRVLTDISFIGARRNGEEQYTAYVGGRLGLNPFVGVKIAEHLLEENCVRLVQNYFALLQSEGREGERSADLISRLGEERVKHELNKNLSEGPACMPVECETRLRGKETDKLTLRVRATCGEVSSKDLRKIADIAERYGKGFVHFSVRGSPELPCIDKNHIENIRQELRESGMQILDEGIDNLQTCFGNYCTESLMDTQSLLRRIAGKAEELCLNNLNIKVSAAGCPNSCGIAQLNDIGFYGSVEVAVDVTKCNGCGLCASVCKRTAITIEDGGARIDGEKCKHCGQCMVVCPSDAIAQKRKGITVFAGGTVGENTRLGERIAEFLSEDEAVQVAERCLRLLKERKTNAATIFDEIGMEKFKDLIGVTDGRQNSAG